MKSRFFWRGILVLAAMGAVFYFFFFSEFFQVEKVIVTGEEKVQEEEIKALIPKNNIFLTDLGEIREYILSAFPQIAEVQISRGFPDALNILVIERMALALWCEEGKCFLIDQEGVPFEEAPLGTDLLEVSGKKELLKEISQVLEIRSKLKEVLDIEIEGVSLVSSKRLNIETSEGWEIYFDLGGDLDWQIQKLGLVLDKQIPPEKRGTLEYIDLRFSRVYYK